MKNKNKNNQSMTRKNLSNLSTEEKILRLKKQIQEGEVFCDDTRALIPNAIITEQNRVASAHEFLMDTTNHIEAAEQELNEINFQIHALRQALEEEIQAERSKIAYIETLKAYEYEHRKCIEDHDSRLESAIATHVNSWRITSMRAYEKKLPHWKEQLEALQKKVDEKTKAKEEAIAKRQKREAEIKELIEARKSIHKERTSAMTQIALAMGALLTPEAIIRGKV